MSPTEPCVPYVAVHGDEDKDKDKDKDEDPRSDPRVFV